MFKRLQKKKNKSNRNQRKEQLNEELSALPMFMPWQDCEIVHINRSTPSIVLYDLIDCARQTTKFTIDTESDYYTHKPALIQIEFIHPISIVLLVEMCHLPEKNGTLDWLMRSLFKVILQPSNVIFSWGDAIGELLPFVQYGLFSMVMIRRLDIVDVQLVFKDWYNRTYVHLCDLPIFYEDNPSCSCIHRPVKEKSHEWSLQKAIAYGFGEFLDKSRTKSSWSEPLQPTHSRRLSSLQQHDNIHIVDMVQYAVDDCLAVTKLGWLIGCI